MSQHASSPGRLDRSPCGTGTSARLAQLHARGLIGVGERFLHESVIGTTFESSIVALARVGSYDAVVLTAAGQAWITGIYQMGMDRTDPCPRGFTLPAPGCGKSMIWHRCGQPRSESD